MRKMLEDELWTSAVKDYEFVDSDDDYEDEDDFDEDEFDEDEEYEDDEDEK